MRKILNQKENMKKNYEENPEPKTEYEKKSSTKPRKSQKDA